MITIALHCPHCQSEALVRNGQAPNGKQKYLCRACHRQSREDPIPHAYQERSSLRGRERTFGVSRMTILTWIKKSRLLVSIERDPDRSRSQRSRIDDARTR